MKRFSLIYCGFTKEILADTPQGIHFHILYMQFSQFHHCRRITYAKKVSDNKMPRSSIERMFSKLVLFYGNQKHFHGYMCSAPKLLCLALNMVLSSRESNINKSNNYELQISYGEYRFHYHSSLSPDRFSFANEIGENVHWFKFGKYCCGRYVATKYLSRSLLHKMRSTNFLVNELVISSVS